MAAAGCRLFVAAAGYGKTTALEAAGAGGCLPATGIVDADPADLLRSSTAGHSVAHLAVDDLCQLPARSQVRLARALAALPDHVRVDRYDEDWAALWWARADGRGRVLDAGEAEAGDALRLLTRRYAQYQVRPPRGPVLAIDVERWSGWAATRHPA